MRSGDAASLMNGHKFIDGSLVSAKAERIVRAIRDYCDELDVNWIPPSERKDGEAAYAIIHNAPENTRPYVLFYVKDDEDFDERVLQRIIANDQRTRTVSLSEYEAWEEAQRRIAEKEREDILAEAHDIARFAIKTKLNKFTIPDGKGGLLTIRE